MKVYLFSTFKTHSVAQVPDKIKYYIPTVEHEGENIMVWGCFFSRGDRTTDLCYEKDEWGPVLWDFGQKLPSLIHSNDNGMCLDSREKSEIVI